MQFSSKVYSQVADYIFPHFDQPSYSNYGTIGRSDAIGKIAQRRNYWVTWSHADPYLRGSVMGNPFDWFEASYQYTDVNNKLYSDSPAFSGSQSYKDKSFDAKI